MQRLRLRLAVLLPSLVAAAFVAASSAPPASVAAIPPNRPNKPVCPGPLMIGAAACHSRVITDRKGAPLATTSPTGYGPADFHGAYALPNASSTSQTIAIVDAYDDATIESDLAQYSSTYGLPACTKGNGCFRKVNQSGNEGPYPNENSGWALEIALDVETAHAICQNCEILLVEATTNSLANLGTAVDTAASLGATEISNSYGGAEYSGETSDLTYHHPGIAITASAGDSGYGPEYPAASPDVIAVGGTTLTVGSSQSYGGETVWSGTGSGCSAYASAPGWQTSDPHWAATKCGTKRGIADVAADADPNTGASVYDTTKYQGQKGWFTVGGTSLSAPLIASVYALAGGGSADYPAADPYSHQSDSPASLHDVTSGSNFGKTDCGTIMCKGAVGYDGPTGVGTPKGIAAFSGGGTDTTPPQTTIDSGPTGPTNDATPEFSFSSSEPGSSFQCRIDAASFTSCASPYTTATLADGAHTFEVRAIDAASNVDPSPASRSFTLDTTPPDTTITAGPTGPTNDATPEFSFSSNESGSSFQCRIDVASFTSCTSPYTTATLADGAHTFEVRAIDAATNVDPVPAASSFTVDTAVPTSQASSPASSTNTTISVSYTASDSGSGLATVELWAKPPGAGSYAEVATDSSPGASGSIPYTAAAGDGSYAFYTRATDHAGNYEAAPTSADSTTQLETALDTTPPETTAISPPPFVPPSADFSFLKVIRKSGSHTAKLLVRVPGRGSFVVFGRQVRKVRRQAAGAGLLTLPVRLKKRFNRLRKVMVTGMFTPLGGFPATKQKMVKFR